MKHVTLGTARQYRRIDNGGPAITVETNEATIVIEQGDRKTMYYVVNKTTGKQSEIYAIHAVDKSDPSYCDGCQRIVKSWYDHSKECPNA